MQHTATQQRLRMEKICIAETKVMTLTTPTGKPVGFSLPSVAHNKNISKDIDSVIALSKLELLTKNRMRYGSTYTERKK